VLSGRCYDIVVLNVRAPSEEKCDNLKGSFYKELEQVLDHSPKYHMTILLGDFNSKL
jgi:exonuclease III